MILLEVAVPAMPLREVDEDVVPVLFVLLPWFILAIFNRANIRPLSSISMPRFSSPVSFILIWKVGAGVVDAAATLGLGVGVGLRTGAAVAIVGVVGATTDVTGFGPRVRTVLSDRCNNEMPLPMIGLFGLNGFQGVFGRNGFLIGVVAVASSGPN